MNWNDTINGAFELSGGLANYLNVRQLYKDKKVRGIHWSTYAFFTTWGIWNLWYYPSLNQWMSFAGGCSIVLMNMTWLSLALYYIKQERNNVIP